MTFKKAGKKGVLFKPSAYLLMWLLFLSLQFQTVNLLSIAQGDGAIAVKPYHLLTLLCALTFLSRRAVSGPGWGITSFLVVGITVSIVNILDYGLDPMLLNYVFAAGLVLVVVNLGRTFTEGEWLRLLRSVSLLMLIAVLAKAVIYWEAFTQFFAAPFGHPILPMFYGGGPNLEATWLSLASLFFLRTRLFFPVIAVTAFISAIYASRIALVISLACLLVGLLQKREKRRFALLLLIAAFALVGGLAVAPELSNLYVVDRVTQIGTDPGSTGRLQLWAPVSEALLARPFGYGAGNAIFAVRELSEAWLPEDNVHNYYFQVGLDFGLIGLFVLFWLVIRLFVAELLTGFSRPTGNYLLIFALSALLQFRGAEPTLWFVIGVHILVLKKSRQKAQRMSVSLSRRRTLAASRWVSGV